MGNPMPINHVFLIYNSPKLFIEVLGHLSSIRPHLAILNSLMNVQDSNADHKATQLATN